MQCLSTREGIVRAAPGMRSIIRRYGTQSEQREQGLIVHFTHHIQSRPFLHGASEQRNSFIVNAERLHQQQALPGNLQDVFEADGLCNRNTRIAKLCYRL